MQPYMFRSATVLTVLLAVRAMRQDQFALLDGEDDSVPSERGFASLVAVGDDVSGWRAAVENNAKRAGIIAELVANRSRTQATPPCPWQGHLNNDGVEVGSGSFGQVYVATVACDGKTQVAIKELRGTTKTESEKEAKLMDTFAWSPNFVNVYGAGKSLRSGSNVQYILMEAAGGGTFEKYLQELKRNPSSETAFNDCVGLWLDMVEGVWEMHKDGYLHRDLKPENVLVSQKCSKGTCHGKIADLGLSCYLPHCRGVTGTPYYFAPELLKFGQLTRKNDVWALGLMLYQVLNKGMLPLKFKQSFTLPALEAQIKNFIVTAELEYKQMPEASGLKTLLAAMMVSDWTKRWNAEESLNFALGKLKGCYMTTHSPLCTEDETKVVSMLPSCWKGDPQSTWFPSGAKVLQDAVQAEPVRQEEELSDEDSVLYEGTDTVTKTIAAGAQLGIVVDSSSGAVLEYMEDGIQAKELGILPGWVFYTVAGFPYDFSVLKKALQGQYGSHFAAVFKVPKDPKGGSLDLGEEGDGDEILAQGTKVSLKIMIIQQPVFCLATAYIFRPEWVDENGLLLPGWGGVALHPYFDDLPLKVGDVILKVNDRPWKTDVFGKPGWINKAKAGLFGPLKFEYARPSE